MPENGTKRQSEIYNRFVVNKPRFSLLLLLSKEILPLLTLFLGQPSGVDTELLNFESWERLVRF